MRSRKQGGEQLNQEGHCHVEPITKSATEEELTRASNVMLAVLGMGCVNCANRVRNSIVSLNGVVSAKVDHGRGLADVSYDPELTTIDELVRAVARAGGDGRHEYRAYALP